PRPLEHIIDYYQIRTVLCLTDPEPRERSIAESLGASWLCLSLSSSSAPQMFDQLESAARILADPARRPIFFHCKRGIYRSNLVQAVYRMKECGWTLERTLDELRRQGYAPETSGADRGCAELFTRYYQERILSARRELNMQAATNAAVERS